MEILEMRTQKIPILGGVDPSLDLALVQILAPGYKRYTEIPKKGLNNLNSYFFL